MTQRPHDEFHRMRTAYLRLRAAMRDPVTGLFHYALAFDEVRALLADRTQIGVLWVSLGERRLIETVYGWEAYDRVLMHVSRVLADAKTCELPATTIIANAGIHADAFCLFINADLDGADLSPSALAEIGSRLEALLDERLAAIGDASVPGAGRARIGTALMSDNPFHRFERLVYTALEDARSVADRPRDSERLAWMAELQRVLRDGDVHAVFQPVINLEDGAEVGLEAFTRGSDISVFHLPRVMFSVGREAGLAGELDRLCRHSAFEALAGGVAPRVLFVNTTADSLVDPDWWAPETLAAMRRAGLDPSHVVLEVNESSVAENPDGFRDAIDWLRSVGYRLSLDDVGSSQHTSLIVEKLRPEFLKFDLTLVRGIEGDQLRRELVRSLVQLAQRAGATLIAERIESEDERRTLIECGARWGQGYLFAAETSRSPVAGAVPRPRVEL